MKTSMDKALEIIKGMDERELADLLRAIAMEHSDKLAVRGVIEEAESNLRYINVPVDKETLPAETRKMLKEWGAGDVSLSVYRGKWQIRVNRKKERFGSIGAETRYYDSLQEAHAALDECLRNRLWAR